MKSFELIQILTKGLVPVERCGTAVFKTSDLSELSMLFGRNYSWAGHMFSGDVLYVYHYANDDWTIEDADLVGFNLEDEKEVISVFKVRA